MPFGLLIFYSVYAYESETHLREVTYCDVIKRQMMSWLTLSGDIRQHLTFKENSGIDIDIDIEDLFTVEYGKPFNISSVALFLRQTYVK